MAELAHRPWRDPGCRRIAKRLGKHGGELCTFASSPRVEKTNNQAKRALRPRMVRRKISGPPVMGGGEETRGANERIATCSLSGEDFLAPVTTATGAAVPSAR